LFDKVPNAFLVGEQVTILDGGNRIGNRIGGVIPVSGKFGSLIV
jgi:hypothetical protein